MNYIALALFSRQ